MKILSLLAQHLMDVHNGDNWTEVNIADTVSDISFEEANILTPASANTIAMLLHHISFWNRAVAQRAKGIPPYINDANGFDVKTPGSAEDWKALQEDNIRSAEELAAVILNFAEAKLADPILPDHSSAYKNLQGNTEHVHYHLGQIVMLKKLIRAKKKANR